jgi:hypothetical protein
MPAIKYTVDALELSDSQVLEDNLGIEETVKEAHFNAKEVADAAKNSLDFLAGLAMPLVFKYFFPPIFKDIWAWLCQHIHKTRDFSQLAIGLPRGFGKTMVIKLFIIYTILFTKKQFILIICGTQTKANNIIADVFSMLSESNILRVFGDWKLAVEMDRQDLKRFGFRGRNIIVMGAGAQSDIRGITLENARPDLMIFDDIQTRDEADSEVVSTKLETWMTGTAMKAKSPEGCLFVFIANMYPTKWSLLRRIKANPTWTKFIVGGILADGTSLWEDLQPIKQLLKEYANDVAMGHPEVFYAEVLNDEYATVNNLIDISKLPDYPFTVDQIHTGNFIIIDPASGKDGGDAVSIMYFEVLGSYPVCKQIVEGRLSPGDTIAEALKIALTKNCRLIAIEANSYQYTLKYWFEFICTQRGIIGIDAVEVYSGMFTKNARIINMFKQLMAGEIFVEPSCRSTVYLQITQFNALKRDNVDGLLDCLTYAPKVIELYGHMLLASTIIEEQEFSSIRVRSEHETSSF